MGIRPASAIVVSALLAALACTEDPARPGEDALFRPSEPKLLSTGSPGKDEDATVLRARDGSIYVAWFSDRGNNSDVYITRTRNGTDWDAPVRVTTSTDGDFYPNLYQDDRGIFHLVWFRWEAPFRGHIRYNSSPDGMTWQSSTEEQVSTGTDVDDWVPTLTEDGNGRLLVFFVSGRRNQGRTSDLYMVLKAPAASWSPALLMTTLSSPTEHDHLPFVARTDSRLSLVWMRHDTTEALPWLNPRSSLYYSSAPSSTLAFTTPQRIATDAGNAVNIFPTLYVSLSGEWSLAWLSTRSGEPKVFELPWQGGEPVSAALHQITQLPPGYSHRIAATTTPGVYVAVWVQGPEGSQDIYYRIFRR